MRSEVEGRADFQSIRYGQVWEDADVLLAGLDVQPGDTCFSIASAGDNALALLTRDPARVVAVDLSPAQIACLELRVAAYKCLTHAEMLALLGSARTTAAHRLTLFSRCARILAPSARAFWSTQYEQIYSGIGGSGKFERYFALFRTVILPLVHERAKVRRLLRGGTPQGRERFYADVWDTPRWRLLFRLFFSRTVMGRLGRDPSFFQYVEGTVGDRILARARHAVTELDPAQNPYLHWILTGRHGAALPLSLRPESFEPIRANLDRLEWRVGSVEDYLETCGPDAIDRFNLSDIFEYMSLDQSHRLLERLATAGRSGGRLAYWNMLAPRSRPESMAGRLRPLTQLATSLHAQDKAFFYSAFVVEEIV